MTSSTTSTFPEPKDHWLLTGVSTEDLQPLLDAGREDYFFPGEVIFKEHDASTGLYLVLGGTVRITATGANGETLLAIVRQNEVLGEMGVLDGEKRSATAAALTVCAIYFLPTEPLLDLLERSSTVCMRLLALLARRLRATNTLAVEVPGATVISQADDTLAL